MTPENPGRDTPTDTPATITELGVALFELLSGRGEPIAYAFDDAELATPGAAGASRTSVWLDGTLHATIEDSGLHADAGTVWVDADLRIAVDGRSALLYGSGQHLTLELANTAILRDLFRARPPRSGHESRSARELPWLLVQRGLTISVRDDRGPLFLIGADAEGESLKLPVIGRLDNVKLASRGALFRLAMGG